MATGADRLLVYVAVGAKFKNQLFKKCSTLLFGSGTSTLKEKFEGIVGKKIFFIKKRVVVDFLFFQYRTRSDPLFLVEKFCVGYDVLALYFPLLEY